MTCNHDDAQPFKATLREHMIRAHGCTEAHIRYALFMNALSFGVAMARIDLSRRIAQLLSAENIIERFAEITFEDEPSERVGFLLGYRLGERLVAS